MSNVALVSMEPANSLISGTRLMARALDALALANVEVLVFTSSSYRQSFCLLVRKPKCRWRSMPWKIIFRSN